jgi:elongation factor Tu
MVDDKELLELVELEVRELLSSTNFGGQDPRSSSAVRSWRWMASKSELGEACINRLAEALDSYIPTPKRLIDGPFLMPVEDVFSIGAGGRW